MVTILWSMEKKLILYHFEEFNQNNLIWEKIEILISRIGSGMFN